MNVQPQRTGPSPLSCAVTLGEAVRDEHGRAGVEAYVKALSPLLPRELIDQLAYRLNVPIPAPAAPPSLRRLRPCSGPRSRTWKSSFR
ncbi:MAG: hypothetical protein II412_07525 [Clostridia bacterium]|nr:hypothetical protein [Clostridia bacterium]